MQDEATKPLLDANCQCLKRVSALARVAGWCKEASRDHSRAPGPSGECTFKNCIVSGEAASATMLTAVPLDCTRVAGQLSACAVLEWWGRRAGAGAKAWVVAASDARTARARPFIGPGMAI